MGETWDIRSMSWECLLVSAGLLVSVDVELRFERQAGIFRMVVLMALDVFETWCNVHFLEGRHDFIRHVPIGF
jgi:hypothetical protein